MTEKERQEIIELIHTTVRSFFAPFPEGELEGRPLTQTEKVLVAVNADLCKKIKKMPTVETYTFEQVKDLVELNKKLSEERPHGEWRVHSHCSDGFSYKCSLCGRVVNQGYWFEQKEILSVYPYCHCGAEMVAVENPFKWYFGLGKSDDVTDMKYIKVGNVIYTQDDDKQGWTGREENK